MKINFQTIPLQLIKKIIFSICFSLMGYGCYSQVSFGVKSGINIATTKDLIAYPKNRVGWYARAFAKIPIHKKYFCNLSCFFQLRDIDILAILMKPLKLR